MKKLMPGLIALLVFLMSSIVAYASPALSGSTDILYGLSPTNGIGGSGFVNMTDGDDTTNGNFSGMAEYTLPSPTTIGGFYLNILPGGSSNYSFQLKDVNRNVLYSSSTFSGSNGQPYVGVTNNWVNITSTSNVKYVTLTDSTQWPINEFALQSSIPDTIPPPIPGGLTGTPGNTVVSLSWNAVTASDLSGYNVWQDGVKISTLLTGTTYTVTGLTNGVNYSFQVSSVDTSGNESNRSTSLSLQPVPPPDSTPPDAPTNLTALPGDKQAYLSWTPAIATDKAGYNVYRNGIKQNLTLISATNYLQTSLSNGTAYTYTVKTVDTSGNESASASNSVVVTPVLAPVPLGMTLSANGTSIIVSVTGGKIPYDVNWGTAQTDTFSATSHYIMGTTKGTNYTVTLTDANGATVTKTVNTGTFSAPLAPIMPDSTTLFQSMINSFGKAGTIALIVIGGAVALGLIVILALWAWRLTKKWLASSK
jgi:hypothetical protein